MDQKLQKAANDFLSTAEGRKLAAKQDDLKRLTASRDGEKVQQLLQKSNFEKAVQDGDTDALRSALQEVAGSEAGSRLIQRLREMMENG